MLNGLKIPLLFAKYRSLLKQQKFSLRKLFISKLLGCKNADPLFSDRLKNVI